MRKTMFLKCARTTLGMLILISGVQHAWGGSGKTCLSYEPTVVKVTGTMISRTYPGPPNYESIRAGDEPETYWFLVLPRPICVKQADPSDPINEAKSGIRRIQLITQDEKADAIYGRLIGKRVVATGKLYGSVTMHHKTPVLLWVNTLVAQPAPPKKAGRSIQGSHPNPQ
jgi:hypothetical protein